MKHTRENFIALMAKMEDKYRKAEAVAETINGLMGDTWTGTNFLENMGFNWYVDYLVGTLEKMYEEELKANGEPEAISIFVYEGDFGKDERHACGILTAGDLYDKYLSKSE